MANITKISSLYQKRRDFIRELYKKKMESIYNDLLAFYIPRFEKNNYHKNLARWEQYVKEYEAGLIPQKTGPHITHPQTIRRILNKTDKAPLITERAVFQTSSIQLEDMEEIMKEMHNDIGLAYCILRFDNPRATKTEIINALTQLPAPRYYVNIKSRTYWSISYMLRNHGRKKPNSRIRMHAKRTNDLYERYLAIAPGTNKIEIPLWEKAVLSQAPSYYLGESQIAKILRKEGY